VILFDLRTVVEIDPAPPWRAARKPPRLEKPKREICPACKDFYRRRGHQDKDCRPCGGTGLEPLFPDPRLDTHVAVDVPGEPVRVPCSQCVATREVFRRSRLPVPPLCDGCPTVPGFVRVVYRVGAAHPRTRAAVELTGLPVALRVDGVWYPWDDARCFDPAAPADLDAVQVCS